MKFNVFPSGSVVPAASRITGVPTCASSTRGSVPGRPFTTTVGLWFASPTVLIVQSIRAAKSCWKAVRHRQIVAWSDVYDFPSTPVTVSRELSFPGYESPPCVQKGRASP